MTDALDPRWIKIIAGNPEATNLIDPKYIVSTHEQIVTSVTHKLSAYLDYFGMKFNWKTRAHREYVVEWRIVNSGIDYYIAAFCHNGYFSINWLNHDFPNSGYELANPEFPSNMIEDLLRRFKLDV